MARPITILLHELPGLVTEVWLTRDAPNPSDRAVIHTRTVPGSRPPLNLEVLDLMRTDDKGDLQLLHGWAVAIDELSDGTLAPIPPRVPDWSTVSRYLADTWEWWRWQALCTDCEAEIRDVHTRLSRLARTPQRQRYACAECGERASRQGDLMVCVEGHEIEWESRAHGLALTAQKIADRWDIPAGTIRRWKQEGLIKPVGKDGRQDLWSVWDILNARGA